MQVNWKIIIKEISQLDRNFILAVSGGLDSMFLAHFFHKNFMGSFSIAHFNHGLRVASPDEEDFVRNWCYQRDVKLYIGNGNPKLMKNASSLEAEARRQRYSFFNDVSHANELIVTAHHANDQLETVLMRLMRGCPHTELSMKKRVANVYRPLIKVPRAEIEAQARKRGISWMEDESNYDESAERNWLRHGIIPQLMSRRNILKTIGLKNYEL